MSVTAEKKSEIITDNARATGDTGSPTTGSPTTGSPTTGSPTTGSPTGPAHICVRKQPDVDHCRVNFSNESACNGESACAWNGASGTCNSVGALGAFGVPNGMPSCSGNPADCIQYDPTSTAQDWQCLPQANLMDDNFEICCADNKYIYTGKCNTIDVASRDSWTCPYGTRKTHVLAS